MRLQPLLTLSLTTTMLMAACSPHPGAGSWTATSTDAMFERLDIRYNGQAVFFLRGEDTPAWRCFWGGESSFRANMKCINAANDTDERVFILLVDKSRKQAELLQGRQTLGQYTWQPPADPVEE